MILCLKEHESASTELLGDNPKKLKKWCIFYVPQHASELANVTFASFRIDDIGACTMKMPSGSSANVINSSIQWLVPYLSSAFMEIYMATAKEPGVFRVAFSKHIEFILLLAKIYRTKSHSELGSLVHDPQAQRHLTGVPWHFAMLAALHECGHIVEAHASSRTLSDSVIDYHQISRNHGQEFSADAFAVNALVDLDSVIDRRFVFEVAVAATILFGFNYLVNPNYQGAHYPSSTQRWTAVRDIFHRKLGDELLLKRLEGMVEATAATLSTICFVPLCSRSWGSRACGTWTSWRRRHDGRCRDLGGRCPLSVTGCR
jgi:hypothetical protein